MADNNDPFDSEKKWKNVSSTRPQKRWEDAPKTGVSSSRAKQLEAGVNKSFADTMHETWETLKKIPSDIKKGFNK